MGLRGWGWGGGNEVVVWVGVWDGDGDGDGGGEGGDRFVDSYDGHSLLEQGLSNQCV